MIAIAMPPSTNALYRNVPGKGRVKTKAYLAWIKSAGWDLHLQRPPQVAGWYRMTIQVPDDCPLDLDNLKAVSDLLKLHQVIEDDNKAWSFHVDRRADLKAAIYITVEAK